MPPEECFVVKDAVSGIQAAEAGGMGLSAPRAHDEELLTAADPDVLVTPWTMLISTRWPKAAGSEGRVIAADHARRADIATDDLRVVAARAGCELELHLGRCVLLVHVRHPSPKITILPTVVTLLFPGQRASPLREELSRRSEATPALKFAQPCGCAAMPRGIDRPIRWSRPKVTDLTASS